MKFGIIWDHNGVLHMSGREGIERAFSQVLKQHDVEFPREIFDEKYKGTSLRNQMRMWQEDFGIHIPISHDQFSKEATEIQLKEAKERYVPNKPLLNLLTDLKERKVPMIVVTSSTRWRVEQLMKIEEQDPFIPDIIGCDDVAVQEPSPDAIVMAAHRMGLAPEQCVVIEDSQYGIAAAKKAGCKTIGFGAHNTYQFASLDDADMVVCGFEELSYAVIAGLFSR